MKTLLLILITSSAFAQVDISFIEKTIGRRSVSSDTLMTKATNYGDSMLEELALTGNYSDPSDEWYSDLHMFAGDKASVEQSVIEDKDSFKDARYVFIYTDYDPFTDWTIALIYVF